MPFSAWLLPAAAAALAALALGPSPARAQFGGKTFEVRDAEGEELLVPEPQDIFQPTNVFCPQEGGERFDYFIFGGGSRGTTFDAAREFCQGGQSVYRFGGDVCSIGCAAEMDYVHKLVKQQAAVSKQLLVAYWIGGERKGSSPGDANWKWLDRTSFKSSFDGVSMWAPGEPNSRKEKHILVKTNGKWNDARATKVQGVVSVCKRPHAARLTPPTRTTVTTATVTTSTLTTSPVTTVTVTTAPPAGPEGQGWSCRNYMYSVTGVAGTNKRIRCCYKYFNRVVNKEIVPGFVRQDWSSAEKMCRIRHPDIRGYRKFNPHLASIQSKEEDAFVQDLVYVKNQDYRNRPVWIGGIRNKEGAWKHTENDPLYNRDTGYTNWLPGEPNNFGGTEECMQMSHGRQLSEVNLQRTGGQAGDGHNDANCDKKRGYVCEFCWDPATGDQP